MRNAVPFKFRMKSAACVLKCCKPAPQDSIWSGHPENLNCEPAVGVAVHDFNDDFGHGFQAPDVIQVIGSELGREDGLIEFPGSHLRQEFFVRRRVVHAFEMMRLCQRHDGGQG
jgi:hypothetical protein